MIWRISALDLADYLIAIVIKIVFSLIWPVVIGRGEFLKWQFLPSFMASLSSDLSSSFLLAWSPARAKA